MSRHPPFDQGADVFDPPCRRARTKLDGFRESAALDSSPPGGATNGDWSLWREDGRKSKKTSMGKPINICVRLRADANTQFRHRKPFHRLATSQRLNQPLTVTESLGRLVPLLAERGV